MCLCESGAAHARRAHGKHARTNTAIALQTAQCTDRAVRAQALQAAGKGMAAPHYDLSGRSALREYCACRYDTSKLRAHGVSLICARSCLGRTPSAQQFAKVAVFLTTRSITDTPAAKLDGHQACGWHQRWSEWCRMTAAGASRKALSGDTVKLCFDRDNGECIPTSTSESLRRACTAQILLFAAP